MNKETKIFKAISEPTRLRIVHLLLKTKNEICGCEFVDSLEVPQYNLTKHIDVLMNAGLVSSRKEGRWVYYSACDGSSAFAKSLNQSILRINEKIYQEDLKRFRKRLDIRKCGKCHLGIQSKKFV